MGGCVSKHGPCGLACCFSKRTLAMRFGAAWPQQQRVDNAKQTKRPLRRRQGCVRAIHCGAGGVRARLRMRAQCKRTPHIPRKTRTRAVQSHRLRRGAAEGGTCAEYVRDRHRRQAGRRCPRGVGGRTNKVEEKAVRELCHVYAAALPVHAVLAAVGNGLCSCVREGRSPVPQTTARRNSQILTIISPSQSPSSKISSPHLTRFLCVAVSPGVTRARRAGRQRASRTPRLKSSSLLRFFLANPTTPGVPTSSSSRAGTRSRIEPAVSQLQSLSSVDCFFPAGVGAIFRVRAAPSLQIHVTSSPGST